MVSAQVKDEAHILLDGVTIDTVGEGKKNHATNHIKRNHKVANVPHNYDILVANLGRQKIGHEMEHDRKGIDGDIHLDNSVVSRLQAFCLDFNSTFLDAIDHMHDWIGFDASKFHGPKLFRTTLHVDEPEDTFISLDGWSKGVVFVNNFNLGRYNQVGPQKTLYLPAPLLRKGDNTIIIFETDKVGKSIHFVDTPVLE